MDTNMLVRLATTMAAISVAVERIVEILKGWFPGFILFRTLTDTKPEMERVAWLHVFSGGLGALVAYLGHINVLEGITSARPSVALECTLAGLLASGGSAMWNHILDLLKAAKVEREQGAVAAVAANTRLNLLDGAHPASLAVATTKAELPVPVLRALAALPCPASIKNNGDWIVTKGATLNFDLKNSNGGDVLLVIANCKVTLDNAGGSNQTVVATVTLSSISFTASTVGTYTIRVASAGPAGSSAELVERCTGESFLEVRPVDPVQFKTIQSS